LTAYTFIPKKLLKKDTTHQQRVIKNIRKREISSTKSEANKKQGALVKHGIFFALVECGYFHSQLSGSR
jgi:hypothetical protein